MQRLIIFDLDGTLIDSAADFHTSLQTLFARRNLPELTLENTKMHIGEGFKRFLQTHYPHSHESEDELYQEFLIEYEKNFLTHTKIYEGVLDFLHAMDEPIAICTNKPHKYTVKTLEALKLDQFPWVDVVSGDTFAKCKPDPEGIFHLMRKGKTLNHHTYLVGDGIPDARVAKNAGINYIACDYGYGKKQELLEIGAHACISQFSELKKILSGT